MVCVHCSKVLAHPNRNADKSPSALKRHLDHCVRYQISKRNPNVDVVHDHFFGPPVMTTNTLQEQVLRIIIAGNLPFYFVENEEFKALLASGFRDCRPPTRRGLITLLATKAEESKQSLVSSLAKHNSKIHLALDCWSSRTNWGYLGTTPLLLFSCNGYATYIGFLAFARDSLSRAMLPTAFAC